VRLRHWKRAPGLWKQASRELTTNKTCTQIQNHAMTVSVQNEVMLWNYLITIPLCSCQRKTVEILSCSKFQQSLKQTNLWLYGWRRQPLQQKRHWSSHDPMHGKLTQVSTAWRVLHQLAALQQWTILIHRKFAKLRFLPVRVLPNGLKWTSRTPQNS